MFTSNNKITFMESSNENFNTRQKSVFDELDKLANSRPDNRYTEEEFSESQHSANKAKVGKKIDLREKFSGSESIFKTPEIPRPKKRSWLNSVPDYQVNPHKWTRYDLSDVSDRDISDQGNTAAAMAFLRDHGSNLTPDNKNRIRIAPKFSLKVDKTETPTINDIILRSGDIKIKSQHPLFTTTKREMPEYVVGQKLNKKNSGKSLKPKPAEKSSNNIKLHHLFDGEDDIE